MSLDVQLLQEDIEKASRSVEYQWPGIITADDAAQEIWVHILESPGTKRDLMQMHPTSRYRTISKIGHRIASKERSDYDQFSGNFKYSVDEVKNLLEEFMPEGPAVPASSVSRSAMKIDLERSLFELPKRYFDLIVRRYGEGVTALSNADKVALHAAVGDLTSLMNNSHKRQHAERLDGPGSRPKATHAEPF